MYVVSMVQECLIEAPQEYIFTSASKCGMSSNEGGDECWVWSINPSIDNWTLLKHGVNDCSPSQQKTRMDEF